MVVKPVGNSSQISGVGYSNEHQVLRIRFKKKGTEYDYAGVPKNEYEDLLQAKSIGKYFHKYIRGAYEFQRVHQA